MVSIPLRRLLARLLMEFVVGGVIVVVFVLSLIFANDLGTLVREGCLLSMIDFRLGQHFSSLLPAMLTTNSSRIEDSSSQPRRNDWSPRQAPPGWTIYVADFGQLLAVSRADDKAD